MGATLPLPCAMLHAQVIRDVPIQSCFVYRLETESHH